jgi:hypothetical protein
MAIPARLANDGLRLCAGSPASRPQTTATHRNKREFQMTYVPVPASPLHALLNRPCRRLFIAAAVVAVADWLFFGHRPGLSLALFLMLLAALSLATNRVKAGRAQVVAGLALLAAGLMPIVESLNPLSALFGILTTAVVVASLTNPYIVDLSDRARAALLLLLSGPIRLFSDAKRLFGSSLSVSSFTVWIVPVVATGIFLLLFVSANPLIERWIAAIDPRASASTLNVRRILFWIAVVAVTWPFVALRWKRKDAAAPQAEQPATSPERPAALPGDFFGTAAILRSLVLFNLLFAVQTVLDVTYLWGGVALPDGMTYASYAHRGAYPLIVTALLAAGFVLVAMNPGSPAERVPIVRTLVFLWIAQNVMLVTSSILRLDLYVEIYSLTRWRVAAFIWMVLVAVGLLLIVARIALGRSSRWLVHANFAALTLVVYICMFVNFSALIADYNVAHSKEISGQGVHLDFHYLASLGPQALPAIDRYREHARRTDKPASTLLELDRQRDRLAGLQSGRSSAWRGWSIRGWRLQNYLDRAPVNLADRSGVEQTSVLGGTCGSSHSCR